MQILPMGDWLTAKSGPTKYNRIRSHARQLVKQWGWEYKCIYCGYSNHIEVCHIKDIGSFDLATLISTVNDESNLVILCPNHHWEMDHGMILKDTIINLKSDLKQLGNEYWVQRESDPRPLVKSQMLSHSAMDPFCQKFTFA